ncbi:Potassium/sodium hyperpolarization-activated cyclic nucleotide-gated channel 2 [Trachymyrmex cornetzi]|uniref:Potassium/sodium hyperpolarization-activated cyclic nucleotide-gated channel 2 n=1 Tax=Trachymyrmex cornetzi TaxID=471704 RepID=A0A151JSG4_9HYME|nr:Potassium/sodium hyperpolarization-activated cyclic nucleotide-gated channel 2 [Trachymyrmex cornetzi]
MTIRDSNILMKRANLRAHICDLPRTSGSNLPKLPPNARFYSRWKRNLQKFVLVSTRHPLTGLILRSQTAVAFEKRRHSKSPYRWMIHPCSMLRLFCEYKCNRIRYRRFYWDTVMTVTFLYIFITVPHIMCFYRIGKSSGPEYWNIVYPIYAVCIIDMFFNFITGFVSPDGHEIFLDTTLIARKHTPKSLEISRRFTYLIYIYQFLYRTLEFTILQLLESSVKPKLKYQRIVHEVKEYIHQKKLPLYLQKKLIFYYKYRYYDCFFKENVISDILSGHLNQEILFHGSQRLLDIMVLRNLPRNVLGDLINSLKPVIYLKGDVIYKASIEGEYMYFIASGTVALITFSGKEIYHLHDGDHFGEAGLIYPNQPRGESVIALEVCELLRLHRRDFKRFFAVNSEFYNNLEHIVYERSKRIKKLEEQNISETTKQ